MSSVISLARFLPEAAIAAGAAARFSTAGGVAAYKLPELPYAYSALEPVISGQIMELHHAKHHAGYVANLNKALEEYAAAEDKGDLQKMIALQGAINFNGGGGPTGWGQAAGRETAALQWWKRLCMLERRVFTPYWIAPRRPRQHTRRTIVLACAVTQRALRPCNRPQATSTTTYSGPT